MNVTAASLEQFAVGDGARWCQVVGDWEAIRKELITALFTPPPAIGALASLLRTLRVAGAMRFARTAVLPVRRLGEELFQGEGARVLLAGNALHADLPPEGAGSGLYGWLLAMLGQTYGFSVPVGGAGMLAGSMANRLASAGGTIRVDAAVARIEIVGGRATGVQLSSGEYVGARRAVLADVTAPALYDELIGRDRLAADLDRFQWDTPTMKVNWALSGPIPWSAAGAVEAGTIHLGVDMNGLTRYAADLATGTVPEKPFALLGQMTTADRSRSPSGTESAWLYTHLPTRVPLTAETIHRHVDRVEQLIERHAPGFRALIEGRLTQSPADLEDENPSLVHGAINGGTAQLHQQLIFRPTPGLGGPSTPIDQLYLASSSAHPGGGVHGGPGSNAARAALGRQTAWGAGRHRLSQRVLDQLER